MKTFRAFILLTFVLCSLGGGNAYSAPDQSMVMPPMLEMDIAGRKIWLMPKNDVWKKLDADQKHFVEQYVKAMQSGNIGLLKQLVLPASLECLAKAPEALRKENLDSLMVDPMQGDAFSLAFEPFVQKFEPNFAKQMAHWDKDPVENTHTFLFGYFGKTGGSYARNHRLYKDGKNYFIVIGCPTENSVKRLEDSKRSAEEFKKSLAQALAALSNDERDKLYDMVSKGGVEEAGVEYEKMHPEYKQFGRGVAYFLKDEFMAKMKEKTTENMLKAKADPAPNNPPNQANTNTVSSNTVSQATGAQQTGQDGTQSSPYRLVKMALLLALIFAVSVLLLRVLKRNESDM